jgi:hypothetical protein
VLVGDVLVLLYGVFMCVGPLAVPSGLADSEV